MNKHIKISIVLAIIISCFSLSFAIGFIALSSNIYFINKYKNN